MEDLTIPEGEDPEDYVAQGNFAAQTREYLEEHFNTLESSFSQLNNLYDYRIRDTQTGEILSNLADTDIVAEDQSFYLTFVFDAYGNDATLGNTVIGSDTTTLRKTAAEVIRNCGLTRMVDANMGNVIDAGHYGTEYGFIAYMKQELEAMFPELEVGSARVHHPYEVV